MKRWIAAAGLLALGALAAGPARGADSGRSRSEELEAMVPEAARHPLAISGGARAFRHRVWVSPGYGNFGTGHLYTLRLGYAPDAWLGYEAALGHNPGRSVHAALHSVSVVLRRPRPGRLQPYLSAGYGMVVVFPGPSWNASPVTKNTLACGGGLELYLRDDLALRGDLRGATVFGRQKGREGIVAYEYSQGTIGLAFYRTVTP